jgi:putative NADH-flavin reductase
MKVLVIGGTRGLGREVALAAHELGHEVTVLARSAAGTAMPVTGLRTVIGDALDLSDLERAVAGQQAVVWAVGVAVTRAPVHVFSRGTQFLLAAMGRHGVGRLVCVTGIGAGDSKGHGGFLYDRIVQPLLLKTIYEDKDRQEALLRRSDVDWTIVRPGRLTRGPATGRLRAVTNLDAVTAGKVSRKDVAAFIVANLATTEFRGMAVLLTS